LGEELVGLDRMLLAAARRNLSFAERLAKESQDPEAKSNLEKFLSRHLLRPKVGTQPEKQAVVVPTSEKERRIQRLANYLPDLTDWDLANLLELAKSMHRFQVAGRPRKSKPPAAGLFGSEIGTGPGETRAEPPGKV
jgi:hypothetical protein